eukprot:scaffold31504_cov15-Prasinocladus_malaysianus.AAC.2
MRLRDAMFIAVPFLGWAGDVPVVGGKLRGAMAANAASVTAAILGRSGEQLFLEDGSEAEGRRPLLELMTTDDTASGCHFISGLAAFVNRTVYANVSSGAHCVGRC